MRIFCLYARSFGGLMSGWLRIGIVMLALWELFCLSAYLAATFWPEEFGMSPGYAAEEAFFSGTVALVSPVLFLIMVLTFRWIMRGFGK
jgi:hypothetical protein